METFNLVPVPAQNDVKETIQKQTAEDDTAKSEDQINRKSLQSNSANSPARKRKFSWQQGYLKKKRRRDKFATQTEDHVCINNNLYKSDFCIIFYC